MYGTNLCGFVHITAFLDIDILADALYNHSKGNRNLRGGCMNAEMIIEKIRDNIENYEVFKELALISVSVKLRCSFMYGLKECSELKLI